MRQAVAARARWRSLISAHAVTAAAGPVARAVRRRSLSSAHAVSAAARAVTAAQRQRQGGRAQSDCGCGMRGVACWNGRRLLG